MTETVVIPADLIAGGVLTALGLLCVSMTLTFGALEDAADWAVLAAIGWRPRRIIGAVLIQGAAIGLLGALVGSLAALALAAGVAGADPVTVGPAIALAAGLTIAGCVLAALIPAVAIQRVPPARTLTFE